MSIYKFKFIALFGLLFFIEICFSQTIQGTIANKPLNLNVSLITKFGSSEKIKEFKIIRENSFVFKLKNEYDTLRISCSVNGYVSKEKIFVKPKRNETLKVNFLLIKDSIQTLEEVVVKAKRRFYQKKDTIGYIASEYMDGTERKVKDLLKKLPQIEVNERNGIVRYKGKEIETITLDGDNLFGRNYAIATKNINADIIKAVEAIDNYEENVLMKGISSGGKVSLNLILKERKTDISGSAEIAGGSLGESKFAKGLNVSLLGINKKHKSFFTVSNNNLGVNNSPLDLESGNETYNSSKDKKYFVNSLFTSSNTFLDFGNERGNINDQTFSSLNTLIPINKKVKIKLNGFYLIDKIRGENLFQQTLFGSEDNSNISIFDNTNFLNKPKASSGEFDVNYKINKRSLLTYFSKYQSIGFSEVRTINSNNDNFNININSKNRFHKNQLNYTYKLNDSTLFQSKIHYSFNNQPQILNLKNDTSQNIFLENNQLSNFSNKYFSFSNHLIGKIGRFKYGTEFSFYSNKINYKSNLIEDDSIEKTNINNVTRQNIAFLNRSYIALQYNQWRFSIKNKLEYLKQELKDFSEEPNFIINPSLALAYSLGEGKSISLFGGFNKAPTQLENLFLKPVIINNRTALLNTPSLELQERINIGLNYFSNNLYKQISITSSIEYSQIHGDYFQDVSFDSSRIQIRNFYLAEKSENYSSNFSIQNYIDGLNSNITLSIGGNYSQYFNIINASDLRNNEMYSFNSTLEFNTTFNFPINFGSEVSYSYNENRFENIKNIFKTFTNSGKIIIKPKAGMVASISSDFFNPNLDNSLNTVNFLDFRFNYKPINKNFTIGFIANNILDNSVYNRIEVSDFSRSRYQNKLQDRLFLVSFEFSF
ncbi:hypothetical protein [uncultured Polaribacter sp.]|uniref:hypothetical protein n=1 Tax=uncultured Polaribacter sp. TaxID=174711 RepID=UPI00260B9E1C|nr:hypothetical protein [uncultured Polaribacter sp.]